MEKGNPCDIVYMTGERQGTVKNNTKAFNLCGDMYGGVSNGEWTDIFKSVVLMPMRSNSVLLLLNFR